jgi:hypothetical protein
MNNQRFTIKVPIFLSIILFLAACVAEFLGVVCICQGWPHYTVILNRAGQALEGIIDADIIIGLGVCYIGFKLFYTLFKPKS